MISIRPATVLDACFVAANMREQDRFEIDAVTQFDNPAAIACGLLGASPGAAFAAYVNDQPVCIFGVARASHVPHLCSGWAYGTNRMKRAVPAITKFCVETLMPDMIAQGVRRCEVRTYVGHDLSHGWLRRMGGRMEGISRGYGRNGEDFAVYAWKV